ncbi:MAG: cbb3-type cytochrome oxidase assembly protein CcoS [Candidatus Midichloria sp.]|nr:cbb3-type cytochrome oxidase assembly protein CcoS [Candidatus Midichloria sp.]
MEVLLYLIPFLALLIAGLGIYGVFWSIKNNQFDDTKGDSTRILIDHDDNNLKSGELSLNY